MARFGSGEPGQQHRDDAAAEPHLRSAEHAVVRGDREVAGEGELHRAAEAVAVHGGDGDLRAIPESHDDAKVVLERATHRERIGPAFAAGLHVEIEP